MKYELAIFDLDGTILDTLEDLTDAVNYSLKQCGYSQRTMDEIRSFVGNGIRKLLERSILESYTVQELDNLHSIFTEYYSKHCADKTEPYDNIVDVIRQLRAAGIKTAVISNKADYAVQILCKQYFEGLFDITVGARENIRKKPAPDAVFEVLNLLKTDSAKAVYIGDSDVDIETAGNAHMDCITVTWGFKDVGYLKQMGAKLTVSKTDELLSLLI